MSDVVAGEQQRRTALRRQKARATGLLVVAALIYVVARRAETPDAATWVGFVRAGAEAAMVGGLADWFAVTALFRRPLGLPIPHTALIPNRKDALGESLASFVGTNFLSEKVVRDKVSRLGLARRVGLWLTDAAHARRVSREGASILRGVVGVLRDDAVADAVGEAIRSRIETASVAPMGGRLLHRVVDDRAHVGFVDLTAASVHDWLVTHEDRVVDVVSAQAPSWSPRFVDARVATRVHAELVRFAAAVRDDPAHPLRDSIDDALRRLADDLQHDPETMERAEATKRRLLSHPEVVAALGSLGTSARRMLLEAADDPTSDLRVRSVDALISLGHKLVDDEEFGTRVDGWVEQAAAYVVTTFNADLTGLISETVERWDADETSRLIELQVGRDLQFIRINGTVVGALAGVAIHAVGLALT